MSLVTRIFDKVFHASEGGVANRSWAPPAHGEGHQPPPIERTAMALPSDVAAVLAARAAREGLGDAWRESLDGLLALLQFEASARDLAAELNIDTEGLSDERLDAAVYEALMQRLAENGATTPESFYK